MKRSTLIILVIVMLILIFFCVILINSFSKYFNAKKLVNMIKSENEEGIISIIDEHPDCINIYPSITPKLWHSAMNWRISYPLTEACFTDNLEIVRILLEHGADANCNDGLTPLSVTYKNKKDNWYEISCLLIEYGAVLDYSTQYSGDNTSVLQDIVQARRQTNTTGYVAENHDEVMLSFYYAIEHCDHRNTNWMRVLQHSVSNDRIEIVKFLLDEGYCDVNDTSADMTALMFAARDSTLEMVKLLLGYGADKYHISSKGKSAYDYAVQSNNVDIISLLE